MRRILDDLVVDALKEIADQQTQERLWRSSGEPEVSSLVEATSRLWDDSGLAVAMEGGTVYDAAIDGRLRDLRKKLHHIDPVAPVDQIISNPYLTQARVLARDILEELAEYRPS